MNGGRGGGFVTLEHGSGGALSRELVEKVIYPCFGGEAYPELSDSTRFAISGPGCLTTDSYIVDPPFFPGGDIGRLAVFGTCNDLAVAGARPRFLSLGLIIEEGFPFADLERVLRSVRDAAREAGAAVLTGDTKVVPKGRGGGIYINTSGIGEQIAAKPLSAKAIRAGDEVIVSGPVGAHGIAVMAARERLSVEARYAPTAPFSIRSAALSWSSAATCVSCATRPGAASRRSWARRPPTAVSAWSSRRRTSPWTTRYGPWRRYSAFTLSK